MSDKFMLSANMLDMIFWAIGFISVFASIVLCLSFTLYDMAHNVKVGFSHWRDRRLKRLYGPLS